MNLRVANSYLSEFISQCDKEKVTPSDKEISRFLFKPNVLHLKPLFILFCFYFWEQRNERDIINKALMHLERKGKLS